MKKLILAIAGIAAINTQAVAQCEQVSCPVVTLSGTLTNRILDADTTYLLSGCVIVPDNKTITAEAGVVVLGAPNSLLLFQEGSQFISQGTAVSPVVFTSDRISDCRASGDWQGIVFEGKAPNNNNNSVTVEGLSCSTIVAGGNLPHDNSGVLKYMRIEFAETGLTMVSVGDGTEMHNIQVSYCSKDGLKLYGGTVKFKELVFLDNYGTDIYATYGNLSMAQRILTLRLDAAAHTSTGLKSNSIVFENNDDSINGFEGYTGSANTHPIFSNVTILGPEYCGGTAHGDILNGLLLTRNTEGGFYNSYIDGYPTGFMIGEVKAMNNANRTTNLAVFFKHNSFNNNGTDYSHISSWPLTGCATSMTNWLTVSGPSCRQTGIQFGTAAGYSGTVCSTYSSVSPLFGLASTSLGSAVYNTSVPELSDNDDFFEVMDNRGAFDATDWTEDWAAWDPKGINYCSQLKSNPTGLDHVEAGITDLAIAPNPASGVTYATFTAEKAGKVTLTMVNSIGQVVRTVSEEVHSGKQRVAISTEGLSAGIYTVNLSLSNGAMVRGKVVIK